MKNLIFGIVILMSASLYGERTVDIRIKETGINQQSQIFKAEIQVRKTDRTDLILGGYNMRLYYNSQKLDLVENKTQSLLSNTKYSPIQVDNHLRDVDVAGHGLISYANNLSFLSFSSNLKSMNSKGDILNSNEWVSIVTLEFKIKEAFSNEDVITLAREDVTGAYATAYIEMTEWKGPRKIVALTVNQYIDDIKGFDADNSSFVQIKVGPNPASSDLNIDFSKELDGQNYSVIIRDVTGVQVLKQNIDNGSKSIVLDIRNLASANYLVEVRNEEEILKSKKIIKIN